MAEESASAIPPPISDAKEVETSPTLELTINGATNGNLSLIFIYIKINNIH